MATPPRARSFRSSPREAVRLYFSVPIGKQRIEFDGHRVFSVPFLVESLIQPSLRIESFAFVDDEGEMHFDRDPLGPEAEDSFGLSYGCGVPWERNSSSLRQADRFVPPSYPRRVWAPTRTTASRCARRASSTSSSTRRAQMYSGAGLPFTPIPWGTVAQSGR